MHKVHESEKKKGEVRHHMNCFSKGFVIVEMCQAILPLAEYFNLVTYRSKCAIDSLSSSGRKLKKGLRPPQDANDEHKG